MITPTRLGGSFVSTAALAIALASPAAAQTTPATPDASPAPVQAQAAGTGSTGSSETTTTGHDLAENGAIQDVVVTATRRETNLQQTPISISVVNTQALKDRHVQSLYDLADGGVPSLRVATFEARQSALTVGIRGIVPLDANQPAREQGVGIYVDGIYLGRQHGLNAALFDVERIEVLKGPQGTLFGRNTEGGALNIVTKAPSGVFEGRATAGIANYGGYNADLHLDLPEYHNFSVKVDGIVQYQGPTTRNTLSGQTGFNYYDRRGVRGAVRWKPVEGLTNDFSYDNGLDRNSPFYSQLLNANPNGCVAGAQAAVAACTLPGTAYTTLTGTVKPLLPGVVVNGNSRQTASDIGVPQQPSVDRTHGFTNILRYKVAPGIELRSLTSWRGVDATQWDNSGGAHRVPVVTLTAACTAAAPCAFSRYSLADLRQRQFSQEFQAVGSVSRFDYVAGLYYFTEHVSDDAATPSSNGAIATLDGNGAVTGATYTTIPYCTGQTVATTAYVGPAASGCSIDRASEVRSRSYAAYGQVTFNATDALHLTVGGRYTQDKKRGVLHISRNVNYDVNTAAATAAGYRPLDASYSRFNPTATIAYDFAPTVHGYAKYASGYRAGGASSRTANYQAFGPEDVDSYELGLKTDLFDRRVRLNLAGYLMDRTNSQVDISSIQPFNGSSFNNLVTINAAGTTKIRGIEADLTVNPVEGLTLNASYAYTYTRIPLVPITYTAGANSTTVLQQFYVVFTPRNAASGAIDYALPVGGGDTRLRFHLDANYAQSTQAFDQFATHNDASFLVNGRVSLADIRMSENGQKVTLSVWARNLFNEQYVYRRDPSNSLPGAPTTSVTTGSVNNILGDYGNFNAPRTYGAELSVAF